MARRRLKSYEISDSEIRNSLLSYKASYQSCRSATPVNQQNKLSYLDYPKHCKSLSNRDLIMRDMEKPHQDEEKLLADRDAKLAGLVVFDTDEGPLDYEKFGTLGSISPLVHKFVGKARSDRALFILLVEDVDMFYCLGAEFCHRRFPCIMISSGIKKGLPDDKSRWYLKKMHIDLKLPVLALVPPSPRGLRLLSIHRWGLSSDTYDFTIPDIKWFGVRPSDLYTLSGLDFPDALFVMNRKDRSVARLLHEPFSKDPEWLEELDLMVENKRYAYVSCSAHFLCYYLPYKLHKQDWLGLRNIPFEPHKQDCSSAVNGEKMVSIPALPTTNFKAIHDQNFTGKASRTSSDTSGCKHGQEGVDSSAAERKQKKVTKTCENYVEENGSVNGWAAESKPKELIQWQEGVNGSAAERKRKEIISGKIWGNYVKQKEVVNGSAAGSKQKEAFEGKEGVNGSAAERKQKKVIKTCENYVEDKGSVNGWAAESKPKELIQGQEGVNGSPAERKQKEVIKTCENYVEEKESVNGWAAESKPKELIQGQPQEGVNGSAAERKQKEVIKTCENYVEEKESANGWGAESKKELIAKAAERKKELIKLVREGVNIGGTKGIKGQEGVNGSAAERKKKGVLKVVVTEILGDGKFYVRKIGDKRLAAIEKKLFELSLDKGPVVAPSRPKKGDIVLAGANRLWKRAMIVNGPRIVESPKDMFEVFYIDSGKQETVTYDQLCPRDRSVPSGHGCAHLCTLSNIKVLSLEEDCDQEAANGWREFMAIIRSGISGDIVNGLEIILYVTLLDAETGSSINASVLEKGLARPKMTIRKNKDQLAEIQSIEFRVIQSDKKELV